MYTLASQRSWPEEAAQQVQRFCLAAHPLTTIQGLVRTASNLHLCP